MLIYDYNFNLLNDLCNNYNSIWFACKYIEMDRKANKSNLLHMRFTARQ